ncbi:uncharacterized protein LOC112089793 [Eutrema salsugineum]|uniref:uncharacterized protein LOC112089793 n=1 Tax=Eutrema salsugineum TaxID=72664 RepID=UPI000CED07DF|nr:uncharacterized protein LOC112089793 [Eutrema salsugineum]
MWHKILKYRHLASSFCKVDIGKGEETSFWFDAWSDLGNIFDLVGPRGPIDLGIPLTASVTLLKQRRRQRHQNDLLLEIENALSSKLTHIRPAADDIFLWKHREGYFKPRFDSRNTWLLIHTASPKTTWHSGLWFTQSTPKFSVLLGSPCSTGFRLEIGCRVGIQQQIPPVFSVILLWNLEITSFSPAARKFGQS